MSRAKRVQPPSHNSDRKRRLTSVGLTVILLMSGLTLVFGVVLTAAQLLPTKWLLPIYAVLLVMLALIVWLSADHKKRGRFIAGLAVSAVMTLLLAIGGFALGRGIQTLSTITGAEGEIDYISIYVRQDDPAQQLSDTIEYTYGILKTMDRDVTDKAMEKLNRELKTQIVPKEYRSIPMLLDALLHGDIDAMLFPEAYFTLLEDLPGYENVAARIRALTTLEFKSEETQEEPVPPKKPDNVFTLYISGIDAWGGLSTKSRSDVNILATVNTDTRQVLLLSTPRDYYVPLPISDGVPDKLTHAGIYGVDVSMETVGMIYDVEVDHYFRVNFSGFEEIIDSLGGITVYSDYSFTSVEGYYYSEGENELYGAAALSFARERDAFADGDHQRGRNQMAVIRAVINKALSAELLSNYSSVLAAVEGCFETSMPYSKITSLVRQQLEQGGEWNIVTYSVSGTGDIQTPYSLSMPAYVMIPDQATVDVAKALIQQVYDGAVITVPEA